jgi:mono/diheme cytochrome c family protein
MRQSRLLQSLFLIGLPILLGCASTCLGRPQDSTNDDRFFVEKIKPILQQHCFECHANDAANISGSLALTSRDSILAGGDSGAAVDLENHGESILLQAVNYEIYEMPPEGKLAPSEIELLTEWVRRGVPYPAEHEIELEVKARAGVPTVNAETKQWWSFQKVNRPDVPPVQNTTWPRNDIDHFILAKLEAISLKPAPPASREQLVRRAYYDLTGLPPTPEQVRTFVEDNDPQAYERLVERLLASPHYGEKWGRHWLDLVRYAESNSFERDGTKPFVWRYRDYVIRSFNEDKPYDQFLLEQLAGDELGQPTAEAIIATGYYRLGQWDDEPADPLQAKYDDLDDMVATTGQTMLGLTVNCARCHDHKIDPIPQEDYYRLVSFFENIRRYGVRSDESVFNASVRTLPGPATEQQTEEYETRKTRIASEIEAIETLVKPDFEPVEHEEFQYEMNRVPIVKKRVGGLISKKQFRAYQQLKAELKRLIENPPGSIKVLCVKENGNKAPPSYVRIRGNPHVKGEIVEPGFLSVLSPSEPEIPELASSQSTGRRTALANWIISPSNPLTARVMANRIWQYHFGRGIVRSSSDFGFQGTPPTHPQLLDWLADEFVNRDWSIKAMHRLIMNSNTYRMSSRFDSTAYEVDPDNELFWRFNMRRLTAEEIRDSILAVNRELNLEKMFGPSIFIEMPGEVLAGQSRPGKGWGNSTVSDRRRRSIYIHIKRSLPVPILVTNDSADTDNPCPVRFITTQPTQALGMINSRFTNDQARIFAEQVLRHHRDVDQQVTEILWRVLQRKPTTPEIERGIKFIQTNLSEPGVSHEQALEMFCLLALNLNEFVYLD